VWKLVVFIDNVPANARQQSLVNAKFVTVGFGSGLVECFACFRPVVVIRVALKPDSDASDLQCIRDVQLADGGDYGAARGALTVVGISTTESNALRTRKLVLDP